MNGLSRCEDQVVNTIINNKAHIALLTEVHKLPDFFKQNLESKDYVLYNNPTIGNCWNGTAIVVHHSLVENNIIQHEIIEKGRINKIKINLFEKCHHIYCVYLSSGNRNPATKERQQQLLKLKNNLISIPKSEDNFILGGDFNFIENKLDTANLFRRFIEARLFGDIKKDTEIHDIFRILHPQDKKYTYIKGGSASRLDRFYMSKSYGCKLVSTDFTPTLFSDHVSSPILNIRKQPKIRWGRGKWKLNESLLTKLNHEEMERIWEDQKKKKILYGNVLEWWDDSKEKLKKWFIGKGIQKKKTQRDEAKFLANELNNVHLKTHWSTEKKKRSVLKIKSKLKDLQNYKNKGQRIRSKILQIDNEEENDTDFYKHETLNATNKQIIDLEVGNQKVQGKENVMNAVFNFWDNLWGKKKDINSDEQDTYLNDYYSVQQNAQEENFFIPPDELLEGAKQQNKKGSPGSDGFPPSFYLWAWDIIGNDFTEVINNCYLNGSMAKSMGKAIVTLLPKKGNLKHLENWRPVSLLNTDYKILATTITKRLIEETKETISNEQKCAIKGRQISDIHLNLIAALKNTKTNKAPYILTCYDFKKAFDMLDHTIIWKTLRKLNVSRNIINWIQVMYTNITSQVQINGALSEEILIMRGIRQGCPLSMLLFVIALETLARSLKTDNTIQSPYNDMGLQQYADDLTTITSDVDSHMKSRKRLETFCSYSGLEINPKKTYILHENLTQQQETELQTFNPQSNINKEVKILGIYFNNKTILANNWESRINKIQKIVNVHLKRDVTIFGKTKLINTLILPHINHIAKLVLPTKDQIKKINKMIFDFCWYPRKIEQCSRTKLTRLRKFGGIGIPDIKLRCDAIFASRLSKIVDASINEITESWQVDALQQIGSRMLRITPSLYSNSRRNAATPDLQYSAILKIFASIKVQGFTWKDTKIKHIYFHLQNNLQTNFNWSEILLQEDDIRLFFSNTEREIAWRTVENAYKWRKYMHRHDTLYSYIPGYNTITSQHCILCNTGEDTINHLLTQCQITKQIWIKANTYINTLTTRNFILDENLIKSNIPPNDESQEDWIIPLKMVNIIKSKLISWHQNISTGRTTMQNKNRWVDIFAKQAEQDLFEFVTNVFKLKGELGISKYHLKVPRH